MSSASKCAPSCASVSTFYPQSLWQRQLRAPVEDTDILTPSTTYVLRPHERLEVGKYVPDPTNGKDPSNPKHVPSSSSITTGSARSSLRSASGAREPLELPTAGGFAGGGREQDADDADGDGDVLDDEPADVEFSAAALPSESGARDLIEYRLVKPQSAQSAGSLFFPIHYPAPSTKDRQDPRGLPQYINETLHPNDRSSIALQTFGVKAINLNKLMLYKIGPGAVAFRVVINAFEAAGMKYTPRNRDMSILWAKRATPAILGSLHPYQKINHFPGTWSIGRKDQLAANTTRMRRQYGASMYDIAPASFLLPREKSELEDDLDQSLAQGVVPTYIVKPSASSCGRGIKLYKGMPPMPKANGKTFVCQRYIGNPLLINERKFDLRMYCVVTGFDPLKIYLFDEGLVRFAAEKYPGADRGLENSYMHLTNYSVSKTAELNRASRGKSEDTDDPVDIKWCLSDFIAYLKKRHGDVEGASMWKKVRDGVNDVVIKLFLSVEAEVVARIRQECRDPTGRNCFELYGLDLMVDDQLRVKLIEVNIMPSLATGTTLDKAVKSRMLAHMLTLIRPIPCCRDALLSAPKSTPSTVSASYGLPPTSPLSPAGASSSTSSLLDGGDGGGCSSSSSCHNACTAAAAASDFVPSGSYIPGGGVERYYYPQIRGAPRGSTERNSVPLLAKFNNPAVKESQLSPQETLMLLEADEELRCAGGFQRVFPAANAMQYFPYFTQGVSRNNYLLASFVDQREKHMR